MFLFKGTFSSHHHTVYSISVKSHIIILLHLSIYQSAFYCSASVNCCSSYAETLNAETFKILWMTSVQNVDFSEEKRVKVGSELVQKVKFLHSVSIMTEEMITCISDGLEVFIL